MKKLVLSAAIAIATAFTTNAQNVHIPDANFKAYLVGNTAINTNGDNEIQESEAQAFTGTIDCSNRNIADLTGIEAFTALTVLSCHTNQLSALGLSNNTALINLICTNNQLTSLDLSNNTALTNLQCGDNQLSVLDISNHTVLTSLECKNNQLTSLDLSNNPALTYLGCHSNQLTSLDLSNNTALTSLLCRINQLTTLDLSNQTALTRLDCYSNQLTTLDLSNNIVLTRLACYDNQLSALNVKNGNNSNMSTFKAQNNPALTCIQVDDAAYATANWINSGNYAFDAISSFSENCSVSTSIKEINENMIATVYPNPANSVLNIDVSAPFGSAQGTESLSVRIINMLGTTVATQQLTAGANSIDISSLTKGVYFIQSPNGAAVKFVKE